MLPQILCYAPQSVEFLILYCIVLYSSIYIAPLNSHRQTEALLVRLAPRKETRDPRAVADPGGQIRPCPHRSWQWSLGPLGGRKNNDNNDSIVKLAKCKDFGRPLLMSAGDLPPQNKVIRNFWR